MKKTVYSLLLVLTAASLGYFVYFILGKSPTATPVASSVTTATTLAATSTPPVSTKVLTTSTGKTITIEETNPSGESLSTVRITTIGFASNTPITLETNKLTNIFLNDMDHDTYDELILVTTAQGSGSYGDIVLYTTRDDVALTSIEVPKPSESDARKGGLFEGYLGHDIFSIINGTLVREFPTYNNNDTNSSSTGQKRKLNYMITEKNGFYSLIPALAPTVASLSASSTDLRPQQGTSSPNVKNIQSATSSSQSSIGITSTLSDSSWVWTSASADGITASAPKGDQFVLTFNKNLTISNTTDCNTLSSKYTVNGQTLLFGELSTTKMFCQGSKESIYSNLLSKTSSFKITGTELILTLSDQGVMTFKKK